MLDYDTLKEAGSATGDESLLRPVSSVTFMSEVMDWSTSFV